MEVKSLLQHNTHQSFRLCKLALAVNNNTIEEMKESTKQSVENKETLKAIHYKYMYEQKTTE